MAPLRMLGVSCRDKICNVKIREILRVTETLMQKVYLRQNTWLGHVWQMNNETIAKFALEGKVERKRHAENIMAADCTKKMWTESWRSH